MPRILHILDHSLPQQSGYASRSHAILTSLIDAGVDVEALTSPKHVSCAESSEVIDKVHYWRTPVAENAATNGVTGQLRTIFLTRKALRQFCRSNRPDLLHVHSPCLNGLAALGLGVPVIYEMRSSWEDAAVSEGTTEEGSLRYRSSRALETFVARQADELTVICEGLRHELLGRGIPEGKITVVPNALPGQIFSLPSALETDRLRKRLRLDNTKVIGFFGSFFQWEGVEDLVRVLPAVAQSIPNVRLLLAGGGRRENQIRRLIEKTAMETRVVSAGRVPASDMPTYYGLADVMVYPRLSNRLTEMVTPLKPLEAMAQRTPVVASDIGGHRELIDNGRTGFLFAPGDLPALGARIVEVLQSGPDVLAAVDVARQDVDHQRRWDVIARRYIPVYERVLREADRAKTQSAKQ